MGFIDISNPILGSSYYTIIDIATLVRYYHRQSFSQSVCFIDIVGRLVRTFIDMTFIDNVLTGVDMTFIDK